jgi:tetratricopeptide (TPR) repeat protein
MKKILYPLFLLVLLASCTSQKNSEDFIKDTSGRYLFNANEVLEIYFKEQKLHAKWRGNDNIELLKVNDSTFYMKELNEKVVFVNQPEMHIELTPKTEHKGILYHFKKMNSDEKIPSEYFKAKEFDKALVAFKIIREKDSLDPIIRENRINSLGYDFIRKNNFDSAVEVFKINVVLYPKSSNVYDSLGEAYLLNKDTLTAKTYFKKALSINPENRGAKRSLKRITKK